MAKTYEFEAIELGHWGKDALRLVCLESYDYHIYDVNDSTSLLYIRMYQEDIGKLYMLPKSRVLEALGSEE